MIFETSEDFKEVPLPQLFSEESMAATTKVTCARLSQTDETVIARSMFETLDEFVPALSGNVSCRLVYELIMLKDTLITSLREYVKVFFLDALLANKKWTRMSFREMIKSGSNENLSRISSSHSSRVVKVTVEFVAFSALFNDDTGVVKTGATQLIL